MALFPVLLDMGLELKRIHELFWRFFLTHSRTPEVHHYFSYYDISRSKLNNCEQEELCGYKPQPYTSEKMKQSSQGRLKEAIEIMEKDNQQIVPHSISNLS